MFILGYFDTYNGTSVSPGIVKLLPNGNIDPSFSAGTGIDPYVPNNANYFARIVGETSFYIGGFLTAYNGISVSQIIKLNIDGTVDTSFDSGTGFDGVNLYSLAVIWGDKLIIEGDFLNYNGTPSNYAIILNADGSVYYTFDSVYMSPIVIGNNLFASIEEDCLELLHTFIPQFCNLEGTGIITVPPITTTTTTTAAFSSEMVLHLGECIDVFFPDYTYYVFQTVPNFALQDGNIIYFESGFINPIDGLGQTFTGIFNSIKYEFVINNVGVVSSTIVCP